MHGQSTQLLKSDICLHGKKLKEWTPPSATAEGRNRRFIKSLTEEIEMEECSL